MMGFDFNLWKRHYVQFRFYTVYKDRGVGVYDTVMYCGFPENSRAIRKSFRTRCARLSYNRKGEVIGLSYLQAVQKTNEDE